MIRHCTASGDPDPQPKTFYSPKIAGTNNAEPPFEGHPCIGTALLLRFPIYLLGGQGGAREGILYNAIMAILRMLYKQGMPYPRGDVP
jgi:hypothetical protein